MTELTDVEARSVVGNELRREGPSPAASAFESETHRRAAAIVFGVYLAVAAWALALHLGRHYWFHGDEWDFLLSRDATSLDDLLRPHNEHLTVIPIVAYRSLWQVFGLRSYLAYQIPVFALHLAAAVLLRAIMRRCGVHPWIATAAASVFVLFGPGEENIVWAFQIGFTGSLAFGLAHLLLADHEGRIDRRDWLGVGVGVAGLLCSSLTPFPTAVVGAVTFVRRGWRVAAFHVVPVAVLYLTWWFAIGPDIVHNTVETRGTRLSDVTNFVERGVTATFEGLGGNAVLAWVFAVVLVVGLVVAWAPLGMHEFVRRAVMPLGLLCAGLGFLIISGFGRWWFGPDVGASSRYVHLVAAFWLPALAVAVDALARKWRPAIPLAVLVLVSVIPYGISQFDTNEPWTKRYFDGREDLITGIARSEYIRAVPRTVSPDPIWSGVTVGWLRDALDDGKLPDLDDPALAERADFRLRLGLGVIDERGPSQGCETVRDSVDLALDEGDEIGLARAAGVDTRGRYSLLLLDDGKPVPHARVGLFVDVGHLLRAELPDLSVRLVPAPGEAIVVCRG